MKRRISVNTQTGSARPESFVTKSKQRLKQYIDTVYLNNGDEFEVELYNPTQNKVLAKIEMNGNSIGAGIILRPGERVFLERFLNESKKFLFETYNVEGDDKSVEKSIAKNGEVIVKFYDEYVLWPMHTPSELLSSDILTKRTPEVHFVQCRNDLLGIAHIQTDVTSLKHVPIRRSDHVKLWPVVQCAAITEYDEMKK